MNSLPARAVPASGALRLFALAFINSINFIECELIECALFHSVLFSFAYTHFTVRHSIIHPAPLSSFFLIVPPSFHWWHFISSFIRYIQFNLVRFHFSTFISSSFGQSYVLHYGIHFTRFTPSMNCLHSDCIITVLYHKTLIL